MEIQLLLVLIIAFIVLGPERMIDLAIKLGDTLRRVRETWEEVKIQAYMEKVNKKVMEEEEEDYHEWHSEIHDSPQERSPDSNRKGSTSDNASHRTPQGTENKTD